MSSTSFPQYAFPDQMGSLFTDPAVELERARDEKARSAAEGKSRLPAALEEPDAPQRNRKNQHPSDR